MLRFLSFFLYIFAFLRYQGGGQKEGLCLGAVITESTPCLCFFSNLVFVPLHC